MPSTVEAPVFTPPYDRMIDNAVLIVLTRFEGVPLTVLDIADESEYSESAVRRALRRLYRQKAVRSRQEWHDGNAVNTYWTGWLAL